jgi:hypothetical protein
MLAHAHGGKSLVRPMGNVFQKEELSMNSHREGEVSIKSNLKQLIPVLAATIVLLGSADVARAQGEVQMEYMPPETTVCTPQVEAGNAYIATYNLIGALRMSVEESTTPTGPTTVLFTSTKVATQPVIVRPPEPGVYFWRLCGTNNSKTAVNTTIGLGGGTINNVTIASDLQNGLTAVLTRGAMVCNPFTSIPANRVGSSVEVNTDRSVAVTWFDQDTDSNGDELPNADTVVTAKVNDTVVPEDDGSIFGCVVNTSSVTVSVAFNFVGPLYTQ